MFGVGQVVKGGKTLKVSDFIHHSVGWQEYTILKESSVQKVMYVEYNICHSPCCLGYLKVPTFSVPAGGSPINELGPTGMNGKSKEIMHVP